MALDPQLWTALGCGLAVFLPSAGSAIASASGATYAMKGPNFKMFVPIVQAGVLAIYGLIIAYFLSMKMNDADMSAADGYKNFAAGLTVGGASLASGWGMSVFVNSMNAGLCEKVATSAPEGAAAAGPVDETTPLVAPTSTLDGLYSKPQFIKMVLSMIYLEAIGLYGLIIALFLIY